MTDFVKEVRKIMEEVNADVEPTVTPTPKRLFMPKQGADKQAAVKRYVAVEDALYNWYTTVSQTNYRELPNSLVELYELACDIMIKIQAAEKDLITGGK